MLPSCTTGVSLYMYKNVLIQMNPIMYNTTLNYSTVHSIGYKPHQLSILTIRPKSLPILHVCNCNASHPSYALGFTHHPFTFNFLLIFLIILLLPSQPSHTFMIHSPNSAPLLCTSYLVLFFVTMEHD